MKALLPLCLLAAVLAAPARAGDAVPPVAAPETTAAVTTALSFEGIWLLDLVHSDDPRKVMEESGMRRGGGGGGGGGGGMHHGGGMGGGMGHQGMGHGGMGGGPPEGEPGQSDSPDAPSDQYNQSRGGGDPRRAMERVLRPAKKMVVYVDKDRFQIEEDEGQPRVYTISDSLRALGVKPLNDEAVVRFKGREAEATQPLGQRGALVETYELSKDGHTLAIHARRDGGPEGRPKLVITRVYTRYEGE